MCVCNWTVFFLLPRRWTLHICGVLTQSTLVGRDWWSPRWVLSSKLECNTFGLREPGATSISGTDTTETWNSSAWLRWEQCIGSLKSRAHWRTGRDLSPACRAQRMTMDWPSTNKMPIPEPIPFTVSKKKKNKLRLYSAVFNNLIKYILYDF